MRVRDLLDVPGLGLRLLTDVSGVDRVIRHVYTTDLPDPSRYLTPDGIAPFVTRRESILVRGAAPVDLMVRTTRHGPVLSDVLPAGTADPGYVLALSATFLLPQDRSAQALWEASHAANWSGFREALRNFAHAVRARGPTAWALRAALCR